MKCTGLRACIIYFAAPSRGISASPGVHTDSHEQGNCVNICYLGGKLWEFGGVQLLRGGRRRGARALAARRCAGGRGGAHAAGARRCARAPRHVPVLRGARP